MSASEQEPLVLDFLQAGAPECPLVRLYGTERQRFVAFRDLAGDLSRAGSQHTLYRFGTAEGPNWVRCALTLKASPQSLGISWHHRDPYFDWILTREDWASVAELVEPFAERARLGTFQWLAGPSAAGGLKVGAIGVLLSCSPDGTW